MFSSSWQCDDILTEGLTDLLTEGLSRGGVTEEALEEGGAIEARLLLGADRVVLTGVLAFKTDKYYLSVLMTMMREGGRTFPSCSHFCISKYRKGNP